MKWEVPDMSIDRSRESGATVAEQTGPRVLPGAGARWGLIFAALAAAYASLVAVAYFDVLGGGLFGWGGGPAPRMEYRQDPAPFNLTALTIPRERVLSGGPRKDGIPALSSPATIPADDPLAPRPRDRVIGVAQGGRARAYPLAILNLHEVVNDSVGGTPVAVTYCPLCDSAAVFDRRTALGEKEFGVSGLLFNSNVLMYDRSGGERDSLWSQLTAAGVSGAAAASSLTTLPLELTTWEAWRRRHPDTDVVSPKTGHARDYGVDPYEGYFETPNLMFPAEPRDERLATKERVLGLWSDDGAVAVRAASLEAGAAPQRIPVGSRHATVEYERASETLRVLEADDGVRWVYSLWFAWFAFHPETQVHGPPAAW